MARMPKSRKSTSTTKTQKKQVRKIASQVVDDEIEDKQSITIVENNQLYHNNPSYHGKILGSSIEKT